MRLRIDGGPSRRGWSYYSAFLRCPRSWADKYRFPLLGGGASADNLPRLRGSIVHCGLAHLYTIRHLEEGYKPIRVPNGDDEGALTLVSDPDQIMTPKEAMQTRARQCPDFALRQRALDDAMDDFETIRRVVLLTPAPRCLLVERLIETDINEGTGQPPLVLTARIDLVIVENERAVVVDHKRLAPGTKNPGIAYANDGQYVSMHIHGRRLWRDKFGGVRLHSVNSQDAKMINMPATEGQIERLKEQIRRADREIAELDRKKTPLSEYPRVMETLTCYHRYGPCYALYDCMNE